MVTPSNTPDFKPVRREERKDDSNRPSRPTTPNRDFREVMEEKRRAESDDEKDSLAALFNKEAKKTSSRGAPTSKKSAPEKKASLLQDSPTKTGKAKDEEDEEVAVTNIPAEPVSEETETTLIGWPVGGEKKESPFNIYQAMTKTKVKADAERTWETAAQSESESELIAHTKHSEQKKSAIKDKDTLTRFAAEGQTDLAFVNPLGTSASTVRGVGESSGAVQAASTAELQAIIDKIVDGMYTLEKSGSTETIVTLKNLPLFEGARVVITSFSTASKEFNIAFENLRPDAKLLVDANMAGLRSGLEQAGHANAVHIMTSTTLIEHPISANEARRERESGQGRQQQQKGQDEEQA